jgi:DNA mismatch repair ATPase MutS
LYEKEKLFNYCFYGSIAAIVFITYFSIVAAQNSGAQYYLILLFIPFLIALAIFFRFAHKKEKTINFVKREWGKKQVRKRDFKKIPELHKIMANLEKDKFCIDDQTWQDLTMDQVFELLDRTLSKPGEFMLYRMLRTPSFDEDEIKKRSKLIESFRERKELREQLQFHLYKLGREKSNGVISMLWGDEMKIPTGSIIFYVMGILAALSIVSIFVLGVGTGALMIATMFFCNLILHGLAKKTINSDLNSIGKIGDFIKTAQKIKLVDAPEIEYKIQSLRKSYDVCGYISRRTPSLGRIEGVDMLADYLNIFFLAEEISFFSVAKGINKHRKDLKNIYTIIGEIDAYISLASYRDEIKEYVEPEFVKSGSELEIIDGRHPLLEKAVPNTVKLQRGGIILTGSNMSGKSTFLRMLGVNALLAQTISTCLAKSYKASLLKVLTSISPSDNIMGGKSYYLGEAEALLRIIKTTEDMVPSLCMIDEIFRGTNPIERVSAAAEILDYLPDHNAMTIAATHDIELTGMVKNHYECYYFTEDVGENGLIFDYKIRKGVSKTRNAIKVLKFIGYPDEIIDKANNRIKD